MRFNTVIVVLANFLCLSAVAATHPLIPTYAELEASLANGDHVRAIVDVDHCTMNTSKSSPATHAFFPVDFGVFNKYNVAINNELVPTIATSSTMLVEHGKYGPVYGYLRMRVFGDNKAEIYIEHLDPISYKPYDKMTFQCKIANENEINNGVRLLNFG